MLVLSRHPGEDLVAITQDGTQLVVKVIEIRGNKVRLGIEAPREVTVHRREVCQAIAQEQAATA